MRKTALFMTLLCVAVATAAAKSKKPNVKPYAPTYGDAITRTSTYAMFNVPAYR